MDAQQFSRYVKNMYERAGTLYQRSIVPSYEEPGLAADSLEELRIALEELHVAEEELLQQNEELAIAHAQVELERRRYQDLFEFAPDSYIITDPLGIIQEANRAAVVMLNIPQKFLVGKPLINYIAQDKRRMFRSQLQKLYQRNWLQEWEIRIVPRQSAAIDAAVTIAAIKDEDNKLLGWRWLIRDITARKQAETQMQNILLQNLQLQETARMKTQFMAMMSHELRSPMNAIIGFSQLLLRSRTLCPKQEGMLQRILSSGRHLLKLIDEILDFSKIETGHLELKPEEFNLAELVSAIVEEMRALAEQKFLELHFHSNLANPQVNNDKTRVRQILVNLLSNAIKFTESGSITINLKELPADKTAISIQDTGIGIAETDIKHIFQEFRQLNQTLTRQHGGSGLGLAITDRLVRLMKGSITVESQLGQGSTFEVNLPRCIVRNS